MKLCFCLCKQQFRQEIAVGRLISRPFDNRMRIVSQVNVCLVIDNFAYFLLDRSFQVANIRNSQFASEKVTEISLIDSDSELERSIYDCFSRERLLV